MTPAEAIAARDAAEIALIAAKRDHFNAQRAVIEAHHNAWLDRAREVYPTPLNAIEEASLTRGFAEALISTRTIWTFDSRTPGGWLRLIKRTQTARADSDDDFGLAAYLRRPVWHLRVETVTVRTRTYEYDQWVKRFAAVGVAV